MQNLRASAIDNVTYFQKLLTTRFNRVVTITLVCWTLLIFGYTYSTLTNTPGQLVKMIAICLMIIVELGITISYPITFIKLYSVLACNLLKCAMAKIQLKLIGYFSLMTILIVSRYVYYLLEQFSDNIMPE
jgi:hypothetical protein